jgi:glucose/arabinose dehydrogenase
MTFKNAGRVLLMAFLSILGTNLALAAVCDGVSEVFNTTLETVDVVTGLDRPLLLISPPGDTDRFFVIEQPGRIRLLKRGDAPSAHTNFMDITDRVIGIGGIGDERGLLGLAFHPDYQNNGIFYVNYVNTSGNTVVSRFVRTDADNGDPTTERSVISISQPQSNHNGGWIGFGPDGFLYIGTGDGGGANDAGTGHGSCGNGQDTDNLLGAMLRLDVDFLPGSGSSECGGGLYQVPADNPFVGVSGCDEIWAYGLRNPWRNSWDRETEDFYIGDVGQNCYEEIDFVPATTPGGMNFGWRQMEGTHCFNPAFGCAATSALGCSPACNDASLVVPVLDYAHSAGNCSVAGGYVYRGCRMPRIRGKYFYGDYCSGMVRSIEVSGGVATGLTDWTAQIGPGFGLLAFGEDAQGEIYLTVFNGGQGEVRLVVPPLSAMEVSGLGADQLLLDKSGPWTWEDLAYNSLHPLDFYRLYRSSSTGTYNPSAVYQCIHDESTTAWASPADPVAPASGGLFTYVVTARNPGGDETSLGNVTRTSSCP